MIISFLQMFEETRKKLGRQLQEEEIQFLQWMYNRYIEEQPDMDVEYSSS
ncbi:hypothetical protein [Oceanobacillus piezotolerans]|nr:hypothetical protein [Oceanobacillus piezotolerans]